MNYLKKQLRELILIIRGKSFSKEYKTILSLKTKQQLREFQQQKLKELILHSYKNVPYYTKIFDKINIVKNNQVDLTKFKKIPILTKELIKENFDDLISKDINKRKWFYKSTGGSTGEPLTIIQDNNFSKWNMATVKYYFHDCLKIDRDNVKQIRLWGATRDFSQGLKGIVIDWLYNMKTINTSRTQKYITTIINKFKPELIVAYPTALYEVSNFIKEKNIKLFYPRNIVTSVETLSLKMREQIKQNFKSNIYNFFACVEVGSISGDIKKESQTFPFFNFIETKDNNDESEIIITNLHKYAMPIIRYCTEDLIKNKKEDKKLGIISIKEIKGKKINYFVKKNGEKISGRYFYFMLIPIKWIKRFQIIQEEYEKIKLLIIKEGEVNSKEKKLLTKKIKEVMGSRCKVEWNFVKNISSTSSGKFIYIKSLVKR